MPAELPAGGSVADRAALRALLETVASDTSDQFFKTLVRTIAGTLGVLGAWVTEYRRPQRCLRAVAFWLGDGFVEDYEYSVVGTACEPVVENARIVHLPERALELYPGDPDFARLGAVSYLGVPLLDVDGAVLGHLAVLDLKPLPEEPRCFAVFQMLAARAAAELSRRIQSDACTPVEAQDDDGPEDDRPGAILGRSAVVRRLREEIAHVAATDVTVLVLGETGTGKELVARSLHEQSRRSRRPFVALNCGALPENLVESELFGHERGAFTGATERRDGRFTLADGGTLFLDEIGELSLPLQVKLLRVLQEGEFEPLGSSRTRKVDVRVIAATNRDLERAVEQGQFRGDLYFRLNVFPIDVPPLRDRGNDVVLLAEVFARRAAGRLGRVISRVTPLAAVQLKSYDWPGNIRELQNVIERAVVTARGPDLNLYRFLPVASPAEAAPTSVPETAPKRVMAASEIEELERHNLLLALEQTAWRVAGERGAAALLGLKPSTLASRIKALGITRP
jgi:transcriptional regulator with GAF, ATPase, and Fis domain